MTSKYERSQDHVQSRNSNIFLERIPEPVYNQLLDMLESDYGFINGEKMHLAEYFLGISVNAAKSLLGFVRQAIKKAFLREFPAPAVPDGFSPISDMLLPHEQNNGFSFAYFDAAITVEGMEIIEINAFPTYSLLSVKMICYLLENLSLPDCRIFPDAPHADWNDFLTLAREIIAGDADQGIVISDRKLAGQKTGFSFYAIQHELNRGIDVVDAGQVFEQEGRLFYQADQQVRQVRRFYNRVVPTEAMVEDNYPLNPDTWKFRFDRAYKDMVFVNHPCKYFEISKGLLPYIKDPINPPCYELSDVADQFRYGKLPFSEFVWKDKWGYAGHYNVLLPDIRILDQLDRENMLERYIAQQKIQFEVFRTGDDLEKIVELRFMTVQSDKDILVTPMARIGHVQRTRKGETIYKIHFGDNNMPGYGFCPVLVFE